MCTCIYSRCVVFLAFKNTNVSPQLFRPDSMFLSVRLIINRTKYRHPTDILKNPFLLISLLSLPSLSYPNYL
jgi:hypothetical protein